MGKSASCGAVSQPSVKPPRRKVIMFLIRLPAVILFMRHVKPSVDVLSDAILSMEMVRNLLQYG